MKTLILILPLLLVSCASEPQPKAATEYVKPAITPTEEAFYSAKEKVALGLTQGHEITKESWAELQLTCVGACFSESCLCRCNLIVNKIRQLTKDNNWIYIEQWEVNSEQFSLSVKEFQSCEEKDKP